MKKVSRHIDDLESSSDDSDDSDNSDEEYIKALKLMFLEKSSLKGNFGMYSLQEHWLWWAIVFTSLNCKFTNLFTTSKNIHDFDTYKY